ncbi:ankyrin repeat-containing domain protein [Umbelopsis sp. PMI_123]|nr:ankyrin repeat-containing domain protein [Umbelopsis sp. PMI_123]
MAKCNQGKTALHVAVMAGDHTIVSILLDKDSQIDATDIKGSSSLLAAVSNGNASIARLLLERGDNVKSKNLSGVTACQLATSNRDVSMASLLDQFGTEMLGLLDDGIDMNNPSNTRQTELMYAVQRGRMQAINFLIEREADINANDQNDETAISSCGFLQLVLALIDHNAEINAQNKDGETALHLAAQYGRLDIIKICYSIIQISTL